MAPERRRPLLAHDGIVALFLIVARTVMKALWHGKPMVLIPWGRDQPGVAARAQALGVATVVSRGDASAQTIAAAVKRAMANEDMSRNAAKHSARLRATNPRQGQRR